MGGDVKGRRAYRYGYCSFEKNSGAIKMYVWEVWNWKEKDLNEANVTLWFFKFEHVRFDAILHCMLRVT